MSARKPLRITDIERLENTSLAGMLAGAGVGGEVPGLATIQCELDTNGCNWCVGPTSCCGGDTGDPKNVCVGITSCCRNDVLEVVGNVAEVR